MNIKKLNARFTLALMLCAGLLVSLPLSGRLQAADAAGGTVTETFILSHPSEKAQVTIYGGAYAQIEETRTLVSLRRGLNKVRLTGIAKQYRNGSLKAAAPKGLEVVSSVYQPANLTPERLLEASIDQEVTVSVSALSGIAADQTGKLRSISGSSVVLEVNKELVIINGVQGVKVATNAGSNLSNSASLVLEVVAGESGDYNLDFSYETTGLSYQVQHTLVFAEDEDRLESLDSWVLIHNDCGATYKQAMVRLLGGDVARGGGRRGYLKTAGDAFESAPMGPQAGGEAAVVSVGDQNEFVLDHLVDISEGSRQEKLRKFENVPVKREYYIPAHADSEGQVFMRIELDNCTKHNMGKPLPSGAAKVYQKVQGHRALIATSHIADRAEGEKFKLELSTSKDIKFRKSAASEPLSAANPKFKIPNGRVLLEHTYKVEIENFKKDKDVTVTVEAYLPMKQDVDKPLVAKSVNSAYAEVSVPKSGQSSVTYKVKELGYQ